MYSNLIATFFKLLIHSRGTVWEMCYHSNLRTWEFILSVRRFVHFIREAFCKDRKLSQILEIALHVFDCILSPILLNLTF